MNRQERVQRAVARDIMRWAREQLAGVGPASDGVPQPVDIAYDTTRKMRRTR